MLQEATKKPTANFPCAARKVTTLVKRTKFYSEDTAIIANISVFKNVALIIHISTGTIMDGRWLY